MHDSGSCERSVNPHLRIDPFASRVADQLDPLSCRDPRELSTRRHSEGYTEGYTEGLTEGHTVGPTAHPTRQPMYTTDFAGEPLA